MQPKHTKSALNTQYEALFCSVVSREWQVAAAQMNELRASINQAFCDGYRDVANYGLSRLDCLVEPEYSQEYRDTNGYDRLWHRQEMKSFILSHLDYTAQQALRHIEGVSASNVERVLDSVRRSGLLQDAGRHAEDARPRLEARYALDLAEKLLERGMASASLELMVGLAQADDEDVRQSDLYPNQQFIGLLAGIAQAFNYKSDLLVGLNDPLLRVMSMVRDQGEPNWHYRPKSADLMAVSVAGLTKLARQQFIDGHYAGSPLDLSKLAEIFGGPWTRPELAAIAGSAHRTAENSDIWFGNVLSYWLKHQDMRWPYANSKPEKDLMKWIVKLPDVSGGEDLADEVARHAKVIESAINNHRFRTKESREKAWVKVLTLYTERRSKAEAELCTGVFVDLLPKEIAILVESLRDRHFATDLGL